MTELLLLDELVARMKKLFAGYTLLNKSGILQEVRVFAQWVPQPAGITINDPRTGIKNYAASDYESNLPCVLVQLGESIDTEQGRIDAASCGVKFLTAIYDANPECQGYRDILNIQERIREDLLNERITARRFRMAMPLKSRLLDTDTWPVYFGEIEAIFEIGRPVMKEVIYAPKRRVHE